jgi:NitT/TauT family transport system permease protein
MSRRQLKLLPPAALLALLVGLWEVWVRVGDVPSYLLVGPSTIAEHIWNNWHSLSHDLTVTARESLYGLLMATGFGILLAVMILYSRVVALTLYPLIIGSQVIPKIAIAPLLALWLGFGTLPKVVVAALMAFFPIVVGLSFGLQSVPEELIDLGRSMRANSWRMFYRIRLPHALPAFFAGLKIASTLVIIGAVVSEFVGASEGLGYRIIIANQNLNTPAMFSSLVLLVLLGVIMFASIAFLEWLMVPWERSSAANTYGGSK